MRPYEVMVIFDAGTEAPAIQAVVDRVVETVRAGEGTPGHIDRWGRRPFAYEVKHRREGYYVLVEFAGEPNTVADLDRMLTLADEVVRHKVVRLPEKAAARVAATARRGRDGHSAPLATGRRPASAPLSESAPSDVANGDVAAANEAADASPAV